MFNFPYFAIQRDIGAIEGRQKGLARRSAIHTKADAATGPVFSFLVPKSSPMRIFSLL